MIHSSFKDQLDLAYKFANALKWNLEEVQVDVTDYEIQFKVPCKLNNGVLTSSNIIIKKSNTMKNKIFTARTCSKLWTYNDIVKIKYQKLTDIASIAKDEIFHKSLTMNIITNYEQLSEMIDIMNDYKESVSVIVSLIDPALMVKRK